MIILSARPIGADLFKNLKRGEAGRIQKQALRETAEFWHRKLLPEHFESSARGRYGYKPRSPKYLEAKRKRGTGLGRFIDLILSGTSRRWLQNLHTVTGSKDRMTLRMQMPAYRRGIDELKKEFGAMNQVDRDLLARYMENRITALYAAAVAKTSNAAA